MEATKPLKPLRKMSALEFARRLKAYEAEPDKRFAFFLGAGCSRSSGIPTAGELVRDRWLPRLHRLRASPDEHEVTAWAKSVFPGYDPSNAAALYGDAIQELFQFPADRQAEIERLCGEQFPGFGYAVLAALMAREGGCFNVVLTTNFDDLIADALYLFTSARPLVIQHESLAAFIRPTRTRPLVVKVHGDNRLTPQNTALETAELKAEIDRQVRLLLRDRGLIFMGYGANDVGISDMLTGLPEDALPYGVYWVNDREPTGKMADWLRSREAIWIEHLDFDEMMVLVHDAMGLSHPEKKRFDDVFENYTQTFQKLSEKIQARPDDRAPETVALKGAAKRTGEKFKNWLNVKLAASAVEKSDPDKADAIYREGLDQFPDSSGLLGSYAFFLRNIRQDYDGAEEFYQRAIVAAPKNPVQLGNYAIFLHNIRQDHDRAEEFYQRAIKADPNTPHTGNYAGFLLAQGKHDVGLETLAQTLDHPKLTTYYPELAVKFFFFAFAHRSENERSDALRHLKKLLLEGARSAGRSLQDNIAQAEKDGHPDIEWLRKLAAVITDGADIAILNHWPAWQQA